MHSVVCSLQLQYCLQNDDAVKANTLILLTVKKRKYEVHYKSINNSLCWKRNVNPSPSNSIYFNTEVKCTEVLTTWHEVYGAQDKTKMCLGVNCSNLHMTFHLDAYARKYTKRCSFKLLLFHKFISLKQEMSNCRENDQNVKWPSTECLQHSYNIKYEYKSTKVSKICYRNSNCNSVTPGG